MAVAAAAQLLDELMGRNRNINPDDDAKLTWESSDICRHYLVKFCPHDLFTNTKSDLGICDKVHDDDIKREFIRVKTHRKAQFEDDFIRYADGMLMDVDKRIRKGKQRLALSLKDALSNVTTGDAAVDEQIELLSERITGMVNEAERLGNEGNVEEAEGLTKLVDKLREERDQLKKAHENTVWHQAAEMAASQEKQMEVCEICGAFLIVGDAQQRIDDHLTGKQHMGFAKLREAIQEIRDDREKEREEREKRREQEREDRKKSGDSVDESGKHSSRSDRERRDGASRSREDRPREDRPREDRHRSSRSREETQTSSRSRDDRSNGSRARDDRSRPSRNDRDRSPRDSRRDHHDGRRMRDGHHGHGRDDRRGGRDGHRPNYSMEY